jgi:hypothetical protein
MFQLITFLLIANVSLFIMNTFEAQKAGISEQIVRFYGKILIILHNYLDLDYFYSILFNICCR